MAVRLDELDEQGVVEIDPGGTRLVVWVEPGVVSALDSTSVSEGRDVGATGVFVPVAQGRDLTFERTDDGFVDDETGSRWNVLGQAIEGPLAGTTLEPVAHLDTFWFAWAAHRPDTDIAP